MTRVATSAWILLAGLLSGVATAQQDETGLVSLEGRHIRLVTDLPESPQLSDWVAAFDAAVPHWARHWERSAETLRDWRVTAYLMTAKAPFQARGLLPNNLPDFRFGFQSGNRIWVLHQPTPQYTRHLLLHEGVHAIASHLFGGSGPAWHMEGLAEYLATHDWDPAAPAIRVGIIPADPLSVAGWGRIELIETARQANRIPRLETVLRYGGEAHRDVDAYAWSWLAMTLLETNPEYREPLHQLARYGRDTSQQFNSRLYEKLRDQWPQLAARWWLLANDIEYGFDPTRHRIEFPERLAPLPQVSVDWELDAAQGWQSAPYALSAGQSIQITAAGRYVLRTPPGAREWQAEADGVTIHYHRSQPLGKLLVCLLPIRPSEGGPNLPPLPLIPVGSTATVTAPVDSRLLFRVNEPTSDFADNRGTLQITLTPQ